MTPTIAMVMSKFPRSELETNFAKFQPGALSPAENAKARARWRKRGWTLPPTPAPLAVICADMVDVENAKLRALFMSAGLDLREALTIPLEAVSDDEMWELLVLADTPYVVLMGQEAAALWRPDLLPVKNILGRMGIWGDYLAVTCLHHPDTIAQTKKLLRPSRLALTEFGKMVNAGTTPLDHLKHTCIRCGAPSGHRDRDGMAWCEKHWVEGGRDAGRLAWEVARAERWGEGYDKTGTKGMF